MKHAAMLLLPLTLLFLGACCGAPRSGFEERYAVREVLERITDALNHQEWAALDPMFTDDVVWQALPPVGWKLEGRAAVRHFLDKNAKAIDVLLISVAASAIEIEGPDRARVRSTMSELIRVKATGKGLHVVGTYTDRLVKQNGAWKLAYRTFRPRFEDDVALPARIYDGSTAARSATESFPGAR